MTEVDNVQVELTVPSVLKAFTQSMQSLAECADDHIKYATNRHQEETARHFETIRGAIADENPELQPIRTVVMTLVDSLAKLKGIDSSNPSAIDLLEDLIKSAETFNSGTISKSILIYSFSIFDAFLGSLLRALFQEIPSLIYELDEKEVRVAELLKYSSVKEVLDHLIERDTSSLLRDSYEDVFKKLAARHGLETLTKFDSWPNFVEFSQRRNLITHCDGRVNHQYLDKCKAANVENACSRKIGDKLNVSPAYLAEAIDVLCEVGVMLAHTLWRKSNEQSVEKSNDLLVELLYDLLVQEKWELARRIGKFAVLLQSVKPRKGQNRPKSDKVRRTLLLNYAQAMKWSGDEEGARRLIDSEDWSASIREFRLGVAVLTEDFEEADKLMRAIGKNGEMVDRRWYLEWPIFREFRKTEKFRSAFADIFNEVYPNAQGSTVESSGGAQEEMVGTGGKEDMLQVVARTSDEVDPSHNGKSNHSS